MKSYGPQRMLGFEWAGSSFRHVIISGFPLSRFLVLSVYLLGVKFFKIFNSEHRHWGFGIGWVPGPLGLAPPSWGRFAAHWVAGWPVWLSLPSWRGVPACSAGRFVPSGAAVACDSGRGGVRVLSLAGPL
jgi:hypothetical protein